MITLIVGIGAFWIGLLAGFIFRGWMASRFVEYGGTIIIDTDERREKTVYSLILEDYPETLVFKKEVLFKIDSSVENEIRE